MPRINPIAPDKAPDTIKTVYEELKKTKWRIPIMYQVLAHQPQILQAHERYFDAVMNRGVLDRRLKEKVAFKVAQLNECAYSTASHYSYALKCGATTGEMKTVESLDFGSMRPRDAAALKLAQAMNQSGKQVTDEIFEELQRHFSPAEILELFATVGLMVFASRLADALGLEADQ